MSDIVFQFDKSVKTSLQSPSNSVIKLSCRLRRNMNKLCHTFIITTKIEKIYPKFFKIDPIIPPSQSSILMLKFPSKLRNVPVFCFCFCHRHDSNLPDFRFLSSLFSELLKLMLIFSNLLHLLWKPCLLLVIKFSFNIGLISVSLSVIEECLQIEQRQD